MPAARSGKIQTAGKSHIGRVRTVNQDAIAELRQGEPPLHVLVVADGMGGHRGGEVASQMAVEALLETLRAGAKAPAEDLRLGFQAANRRVHAAGREDPALFGMGTTLVCLLFDAQDRAWIAHVGDSRAYRLRGDRLEPLTADHSVVGELVRRGRIDEEEARHHPQRNELLRAIGTQEEVEVDVREVESLPGDRFLLCSDGLSSLVEDAEIAALLADVPLADAVDALVERANERGGFDNVSVQVAEVPPAEGRGEGPSRAVTWMMWAAVLGAITLGLWLLRSLP
jgi:serine/threonine protein phosphatase PrpC